MARNLCYCGKGQLIPVTREIRQALAREGRILAVHVGRICSKPDCRFTTSGDRAGAANCTTNQTNLSGEPITT